MEAKFDEWALEFNHPDLQNAVSPFYQVEAGNFLWGYENNSLLVKLEELIGGPTSFGLQVCCLLKCFIECFFFAVSIK